MTVWIWSGFPAVMLETVQAASLTRFILECWRSLPRMGRAPALITASVCSSVPVTMLPSDL